MIKSTWVDEKGRDCVSLDGMLEKITQFTEKDYEFLYECFNDENTFNNTDSNVLEIKKELLKLAACCFSYKDTIIENYYKDINTLNTHSTNGFVYIANTINSNYYKIGRTKDITKRESTFKTSNHNIVIFAYLKTSNPVRLEKFLHTLYKKNNIKGEWFEFNKEEIENIIKTFLFKLSITESK